MDGVASVAPGTILRPSREDIDKRFRATANSVLALLLDQEPKKERPLSTVFWDVHDSALQALPEYAEVFALIKTQPAMMEDARIRAGGDPTGRGLDNTASIFLSTFLLNAITNEYMLDEPRIQTLVSDACTFLLDGKHSVRARRFLKGVSIESVATVENVEVRPIEESEREMLQSTLTRWAGSFRAGMVTDGSVVVIDHRTNCSPAQLVSTVAEAKRIGEAMMAYLRIHASSAIVCICAKVEIGSLWPNSNAPYIGAIERAHISDVQLPTTVLDRWNVDKENLLAPPPALGVALRRFEMLFDYDNPDRILDQIIILEALFSDDDKQELANKLSLRVANFLGVEFEERRAIYDTMKNGYNARSKLSHGRELPDTLRGIDQRVSEIVGRAFALYLTYCQRNALRDRRGELEFLRKLDDRNLGAAPVL